MPNFIEDFIEQNSKVQNFLVEYIKDYKNADSNIDKIKQFLVSNRYNAAVGTELACLLQVLNKPENFTDFELGDLRKLFESLIQLENYNLETYLEAVHFEWSVMDNKEKALKIVEDGIARSKEILDQLYIVRAEITEG